MWTPQPESLAQLTQVLRQSVSRDHAERAHASAALQEARGQADLDNYLMYLLVSSDSIGSAPDAINLRATAGLLLKNNVKSYANQRQPRDLSYIKQRLQVALGLPETLLRNVSANVMTTLLASESVSSWPELVPSLLAMVQDSQGDGPQAEGAMSALAKMCEDVGADLDASRATELMVPALLQFTQAPNVKVRSRAVLCLTLLLTLSVQSLLGRLDALLNALFHLASHDSNPEVQQHVCSAFVNILEIRPAQLLPHLEGVVSYTLHCIQDGSEEQVASEACEFILGLAESKLEPALIETHLPQIIPVLLGTMVYSEMHRSMLEAMDDEDANVEDRDQDIKPVGPKSREARRARAEGGDSANASSQNSKGADPNTHEGQEDDDDDEESEDDDDDYDDDFDMADWNLRKCSAAALDAFSNSYPQQVLDIALPHLKERIVASDWAVREAAILAFGAIAEGSAQQVSMHLPSLIPFLVERLADEFAPVRQISCWTLSRYSEWIRAYAGAASNPEAHQAVFVPVLQGLLRCALDRNKRVQESGCSSFSTLCENAGDELIPYMDGILPQLAQCFTRYQAKNLMTVCDAVQTMCDRVPGAFTSQRNVDFILPAIMSKWNRCDDSDHVMWSLLECLGTLTATIGELFVPYAEPVFSRTYNMLKRNILLEQIMASEPNPSPDVEAPEKDLTITSLDMLDGMIQGLSRHCQVLLSKYNQPPLVELMLVCFQDEVHEVRQSAFALLGDMAINTSESLVPYLSSLLENALPHIDISSSEAAAVCNNAIWSVGELCLKTPAAQMAPYAEQLLQRLVTILQTGTLPTVLENTVICLGRLGTCIPEALAPHLGMFVDAWCNRMFTVEETNEKDSAFQGMIQIVAANPQGLANQASLLLFISTVASYQSPSPELAQRTSHLLQGFQTFIHDWDGQVLARLKPEVKQLLGRYNI